MSANIPKEVVVVGGSLGGLFAGIVFTRLGCNVSILERTPEEILVDQGAGISVAPIYPPIIKALMEGGLPSAPIVEFFAKYDRTGTPYMDLKGDGLRYFKRDGTVKTDIKVPLLLASCSWSLLYNMLRANFDGKYEAGYVKSPKVEFGDGRATYYSGVRVIGIHDIGGEKVQVEYRGDDGKTKSLDANMVIGADGQNSFLQQLFQPEVERKYAGYVAWRGTTVKKDLSAETRSLLDKLAAFYLTKGNQVLHYEIPGVNGSTKDDETLANLVWYQNTSEEELKRILTDTDGVQHKYSLGVGKIQPEIKACQRVIATEVLPPCFSEIFQKIEQPFIQAITDSLVTKAAFMNGRVLLIGDAVAGLRPHTTAGTTQAALHALLLGKVFGDREEMNLEEWEKTVLAWSTFVHGEGIKLGNLSQFGDHPMAENEA